MSDTPITDVAEDQVHTFASGAMVVASSIARGLERKLTAALAKPVAHHHSPTFEANMSTSMQAILDILADTRVELTAALAKLEETKVVYRLSPTDIYEFAGWLTTRSEVLTVGASHECYSIAKAVGEYLRAFPERFTAPPLHDKVQELENELVVARAEIANLRNDWNALQHAIVGDTGASAMLTVERMHAELEGRDKKWEEDLEAARKEIDRANESSINKMRKEMHLRQEEIEKLRAELAENEGVIKVWRSRTDKAEAEIARAMLVIDAARTFRHVDSEAESDVLEMERLFDAVDTWETGQ